jgi:LacI family transcriptional regulator
MATIDEIARRAKVSKTTVSFVINGKRGVSEATAAHVRQVMAELDYVPSALAQRFASRKSNTIALVVLAYPQVFRDPHHGEALDAVHETLDAHGYSLLLATSSARFLNERRYDTILRSGQVDGMLLLEPTLNQPFLSELSKMESPVVIINSDGTHLGLDFVRTDDVAVGRTAAEYLLGLGHRQIAMIAAGENHASARDRLTGFRAGLEAARVKLSEQRVFHGAYDTSYASGFQGCTELLTSSPEVTAIFCCNDTMALGALEAAQKHNRPVPSTLSLLGVDDNPASTYARPALTTIRQPSYEVAREATRTLISRLASPGETREPSGRLLPPSMVIRQSCAPPPA